MAQQSFMRRGITKILWLKNVAAATRIPIRAELSAPNATDLTEAVSDVDGWSLTNESIETPDTASTPTPPRSPPNSPALASPAPGSWWTPPAMATAPWTPRGGTSTGATRLAAVLGYQAQSASVGPATCCGSRFRGTRMGPVASDRESQPEHSLRVSQRGWSTALGGIQPAEDRGNSHLALRLGRCGVQLGCPVAWRNRGRAQFVPFCGGRGHVPGIHPADGSRQ